MDHSSVAITPSLFNHPRNATNIPNIHKKCTVIITARLFLFAAPEVQVAGQVQVTEMISCVVPPPGSDERNRPAVMLLPPVHNFLRLLPDDSSFLQQGVAIEMLFPERGFAPVKDILKRIV